MKTLAEALGIEHQDTFSQEVEHVCLFDNYRTYGGGGAGELNGFYGKKHTEETKITMKDLKKNYVPWNVGIKGYTVHTDESKKVMSEKLSGSKNGRSILTEDDVRKIIETYITKPPLIGVGDIQRNGKPMSYEWLFSNMIAKTSGVSAAAVKRLLRKKSWKNVWSEYELKN